MIIKSSFLLTAACFILGITSHAQTLWSEPALPTADEPVTVKFDATGTPLENYTGTVYTHTGLILEGNSNWTYVIGTWGNNNTQPALTSLGNHFYQLEINPSVRSYYQAGSSDDIAEIAFVSRSEDALTQTADLFLNIYETGLNVTIVAPDITPFFVDAGEDIDVIAEATMAQTMSLYVDGDLLVTVNGNILEYTVNAGTQTDAKHRIRVTATGSAGTKSDSTYFYVRGGAIVEDIPAGTIDGINYIGDNAVTLVLHAPIKTSVYAIGDFTGWEIEPVSKMRRTHADEENPENRYWTTITGLVPGTEYAFQYLIDEELIVADPYSEKVLDPWNDPWISSETYPNLKPYPEGNVSGIVSVLQTGQGEYPWQVNNFTPPAVTDLVIYELLIRDFVSKQNYQTLIDTIGYLKGLGVNVIELMPVMEFEGNLSWGYNPAFFFAVDKFYGTADKLREFIDVAHANGMAVVLDIVLNHAFGNCPLVKMYFDPNAGQWGQPTPDNPWLNPEATHPYNVGYDFNHESPATRAYAKRVLKYWLEEFRADGFRFDLSKGFTQKVTTDPGAWGQYDASRIAILKDYADYMWSVKPGSYMILEHFAVDQEEKVLADYGMIPWGKVNYEYNEATMGWNNNSNFYRISYQSRGFNDPNLVGYMESHDEERLMAKNINYGNSAAGYDIQDTIVALSRMELAGAFFFTVPGPKMIWQFGELGYDYHINYPGTIGGDDYKTDAKPVKWDYLGISGRRHLYDVWKALISLKVENEAFESDDFTLSTSGPAKKIHINSENMKVVVLGNFDVNPQNIVPQFQHTGKWYEFFTDDSLDVSEVSSPVSMVPGEYRIYTDVKLETPVIGGTGENHPAKGRLGAEVHPNPSSGESWISFSVGNDVGAVVTVLNSTGQVIRTLCKDNLSPGRHILRWDGKDRGGNQIPSGLYLVRITNGPDQQVLKLIHH